MARQAKSKPAAKKPAAKKKAPKKEQPKEAEVAVETKEEAPEAPVTEDKAPKEVAPKAPKEKQYNFTMNHLLVFMELEDNEENRLEITSRLEALKAWKSENRKKTEWTQERRDAQSQRMKEHYKENESKMKGRKISDDHREKLRIAQAKRQERLRQQKAEYAEFEAQRAEFEAFKKAQAEAAA